MGRDDKDLSFLHGNIESLFCEAGDETGPKT